MPLIYTAAEKAISQSQNATSHKPETQIEQVVTPPVEPSLGAAPIVPNAKKAPEVAPVVQDKIGALPDNLPDLTSKNKSEDKPVVAAASEAPAPKVEPVINLPKEAEIAKEEPAKQPNKKEEKEAKLAEEKPQKKKPEAKTESAKAPVEKAPSVEAAAVKNKIEIMPAGEIKNSEDKTQAPSEKKITLKQVVDEEIRTPAPMVNPEVAPVVAAEKTKQESKDVAVLSAEKSVDVKSEVKKDTKKSAKPKKVKEKTEFEKTASFLDSLPKGSLAPREEQLVIATDAEVDHLTHTDPFPAATEDFTDANSTAKINDAELKVGVGKTNENAVDVQNQALEALNAGQVESAIELYKQAIKINKDDAKSIFGLATSYHVAGQFEQARENYIKVLKLKKDYFPALNNLIVLLSEQGSKRALPELEKLRKENPNFAPISAQIGVMYLKDKDYTNAVKSFVEAIKMDNTNNQYKYNLAVTLDNAGNFDEAAEIYNFLLKEAAKGNKVPENPNKIKDRMELIMGENFRKEFFSKN
jgi:tetratricopeptide (TPR) repeat protein